MFFLLSSLLLGCQPSGAVLLGDVLVDDTGSVETIPGASEPWYDPAHMLEIELSLEPEE